MVLTSRRPDVRTGSASVMVAGRACRRGTVYSGHFMISSLGDDEDEKDESSSSYAELDGRRRRVDVRLRPSVDERFSHSQTPPVAAAADEDDYDAAAAAAIDDGPFKGHQIAVGGRRLRHAAAGAGGGSAGGRPTTTERRASARFAGRRSDDDQVDGGEGDGHGRVYGDRQSAPTGTGGFASRVGQERTMSCSGVTVCIDGSLRKLLECMTLDYSGKLPSPKWKNFNGIKVKLKEKIRLNNIIWREWYRQFKLGLPYVVCPFDAPLPDRSHTKPEAIVLEGNYWKRRLGSVTSEYKKWRQFFIDHPTYSRTFLETTSPIGDKNHMDEGVLHADMFDHTWNAQLPAMESSQLLDTGMSSASPPIFSYQSIHSSGSSSSVDDGLIDCIFSTYSQPHVSYSQSRSRPIVSAASYVRANVDVVQPSFTELPPMIEETMDTLEPLPFNYQRLPFRKTSFDSSSSNNRRSILMNILTARKSSAPVSESVRAGDTVTNKDHHTINASSPNIQTASNKDSSNRVHNSVNFSSPLVTADNRMVRRKIGTSSLPSFVEAPFSDSDRFLPSPAARERSEVSPPEMKPYEVDMESWFESQNVIQSAELRQTTEYPSTVRNVQSKSSYHRLNETIAMGGAMGGASVKNIRRLSTMVDDINGRTYGGASRRASTGSLPPMSPEGFCIPQAIPVRGSHRHSVGSRSPYMMQILDRQSTTPEQGFLQSGHYSVGRNSPEEGFLDYARVNSPDEKDMGWRSFTSELSFAGLSQSPPHVLKHRREQFAARQQQIDQRRALHISSEKKRRTNIKNEFERIEELITLMTGRPPGKFSKAAVLHQAAIICNELKLENEQSEEEIEALKRETQYLETSIRTYCLQLPSTGVPVVQSKTTQMGKLFDDYIDTRSVSDWKYCIFGFLMRPLFESYARETSNVESTSFVRVFDGWLSDKCSLVRLRRVASTIVMTLSKQTSILDQPRLFRQEIQALAATRRDSLDILD